MVTFLFTLFFIRRIRIRTNIFHVEIYIYIYNEKQKVVPKASICLPIQIYIIIC